MSDKIKDGGPAFPINNNDVITIVTNNGNHPEGMSLRDFFAAKAMSEMKWREFYDDENLDIPAKACYEIADAMLKAREER